ncbi:MAG: glycosyltransferase family 4 protein [Nitrospinales bacterium]
MKIAIIRQRYVPYGGAETFSSDYIRQIADAGNEAHVFASEWTPDDRPGIHFHKVPVVRLNALTRLLSFALAAKRLLKRESFDLIQSHERTLYQDIYRAGDGCHKEWLERRNAFLSPAKKLSIAVNPFHRAALAIEKFIFTPGHYKKIVAISEMVKRDIQKHYAVPDRDIVVIYNGVALEKFHPKNKALHGEAVRQRLGVPRDAFLLLTVGSGFERKGLKFLIRALAHLRNDAWRLLVIGKGNWNRYRAFAPPAMRGKMIHLPQVGDIEKYYAAADTFVLPAIYEPFGNVHLEALATSLPVVAGKNSGAAELIAHKQNGMVLQRPGDPKEIADHINFLFDPGIRQEMGRRARQLAEKFPRENNTREMLALYDELLKPR